MDYSFVEVWFFHLFQFDSDENTINREKHGETCDFIRFSMNCINNLLLFIENLRNNHALKYIFEFENRY